MHIKAIAYSILSICPYSALHFSEKFTCMYKGANLKFHMQKFYCKNISRPPLMHYLHDIKQYHTCLNTPCLPNKEMVVPPTGWILEGPTVS